MLPKQKITLIIPKNMNNGKPVDSFILNNLRSVLIDRYGGYTEFNCRGGYKMANGDIVIEENTMITVVMDFNVYMESYRAFQNMVENLASVLEQESIYMEVAEVAVDFISG